MITLAPVKEQIATSVVAVAPAAAPAATAAAIVAMQHLQEAKTKMQA